MPAASKLTVGLVHFASRLGDREANLERGLSLIRRWRPRRKPAVLVFPELWTTGYLAEGEYPRLAEPIPGPSSRALAEAARRSRIYLMAGSIAELRRGKVYNTALLFNPSGRLLLRHTKVHLWDREVDHFCAGDRYRVARSPAGIFATMICYDGDFPEVPRLLTLRGAEIIFHPSAYPSPHDDEWRLIYPASALQNNIYIVQVNRVGSEKGLSSGAAVHFFGGSAVHAPNGRTVLQAPFYRIGHNGREGIYSCAIDLARVRRLRRSSYLPDRRPETYRSMLTRPA
ncbi:MAG: carbon-nitrogen hydrolase family protein [Acidobacteriota bacterium]